ncbi:tetratricopeptide (TPR) repeat protein [Sphingomonas kaistensis]|uniref:Tetratricopeptide (TPR) repeat protein n=1 Tax=Sphingomonas kaistensis TaxID=298708 RepID=A0A7X5Y8D7_9SPHN|nr:toll/interleukin-1 receptor domain-containing protein [Sphingomonas kaistensis]NJC06693.1 tetratricopeptide (TPR) repeat protein [Sphingomonas kaistensis]
MEQAELGPAAEAGERSVFISYATADRDKALAICEAMERRGVSCWISCRDVEPGENYQEAIVHAIRGARALVLVFSEAANNSNEIKKELSLVSRFGIPLLALRIEDVEPSDAFAYELSTRQWIDAFAGWDRSIDALVARVARLGGKPAHHSPSTTPLPLHDAGRDANGSRKRLGLVAAGAAGFLALAGGLGWHFTRTEAAASQSLAVRLTGFEQLSSDLGAGMTGAMKDEVGAAFGEDGVVSASTAAAPPAGTAPAYAIGGSVRHEGDKIKVITRLVNERTGANLWSASFIYDQAQANHVPRLAAVAATNVVRCGLYATSTYPRALPDATLTNLMSACNEFEVEGGEPSKALNFARKAVALTPDFSAGWSMITIAGAVAAMRLPDGPQRDAFNKEALDAANRAIDLDPKNSEAYAYKSYLIGTNDLVGREKLLKQALEARPLACGCEHHFYGNLLAETGRIDYALLEFQRAVDVLSLNMSSQLSYADLLSQVGRRDSEVKEHVDAALDLVPKPKMLSDQIDIYLAPMTGDYTKALQTVRTTTQPVPPNVMPALEKAILALQGKDAAARREAASAIATLPQPLDDIKVRYLAALGDYPAALRQVGTSVLKNKDPSGRAWLFTPVMAPALRDPGFPALARQLGLMDYWKNSGTKPDVCKSAQTPPFCGMI